MRIEEFHWRHAFLLGIVSYAASATTPVFNTFVPVLLQAGHPLWESNGLITAPMVGFALAPSLAYFIMTWDNLINLFVHPWVGARSDHTRSRWGRRKPWLLVGAPMAAAGFILIPLAPTLWVLALAIVIANLGRAIFVPPLVAWLGDLYEPGLRSRANAVISLVAGLAASVVLVGGGLLFEQVGRAAPFIAAAALMLLLAGLGVLWIREPQAPAPAPTQGGGVLQTFRTVLAGGNRNWIWVLLVLFFNSVATNVVEAGGSSFAVFELGMTPGQSSIVKVFAVIAFLLCAIPSSLIASRIGRRQTVNLGLLTITAVYGISYGFVHTPAAFAAMLFVGGIGGALVLVNILPLVYDAGDERYIGAFTGLASVPLQAAAVLGPTLAGFVVEYAGSQRVLFLVSMAALSVAWLLLQRVSLPAAQATPAPAEAL